MNGGSRYRYYRIDDGPSDAILTRLPIQVADGTHQFKSAQLSKTLFLPPSKTPRLSILSLGVCALLWCCVETACNRHAITVYC